ncbi:945_t:CDS:1 [Racocetra fulgida]|uniref:945_t:CDS:1 n=1 Tax=Racocetra fulgida TaxID=60492 RepID=A0A9N8VS86_9GLOM|nr:945_t:CDS:1 [Racocetra fulgida]
MSQLHTTMNRHHQLKEIKLSIKQHKQNNVALPILNENNNISVVDNDSDDKTEVNEKNKQVISVDKWDKIIQRWINMISEEDENAIDTIDDNNVKQIFYNTNHPAINNDAKWKLETLFKDDICDPEFIFDL